jgi:hypothetical protein
MKNLIQIALIAIGFVAVTQATKCDPNAVVSKYFPKNADGSIRYPGQSSSLA